MSIRYSRNLVKINCNNTVLSNHLWAYNSIWLSRMHGYNVEKKNLYVSTNILEKESWHKIYIGHAINI